MGCGPESAACGERFVPASAEGEEMRSGPAEWSSKSREIDERRELGNTLALTVAILARRWAACLDEVLAETGLTVGQLGVLTILKDQRAGLTQREAADQLAVSEAVMSTRTAALLSGGFIDRQPLLGDRRAHLLQITEEGRQALEVGSTCLVCVHERIMESVPTQDLLTALAVLSRIGAAIEAPACAARQA